jgi:hypothetical protein
LAALVAAALVTGSVPALADDHDPKASGHPLRIIAILAYPVGLILDTILFRPAHWIADHTPARTLFGIED